jgi:hypothetical protein
MGLKMALNIYASSVLGLIRSYACYFGSVLALFAGTRWIRSLRAYETELVRLEF